MNRIENNQADIKTENVFCVHLGSHFQMDELKKTLLSSDFRMKKEGEVLLLEREGLDVIGLFFPFGTMVLWGFTEEEKQAMATTIASAVQNPFEKPYDDIFEVEEGEKFSIESDVITLVADHSLEEKIALSYAIAQSTALIPFEEKIFEAEKLLAPLPKELAEKGTTSLSDKDLRKLIGSVLQKKHEVNLGMGLAETPEYFWECPDAENFYHKMGRYLELASRAGTLNKKISVLHETLDVLRDESNVRHSAFLEWIIIILIMIEICFTTWEYIEKYFG